MTNNTYKLFTALHRLGRQLHRAHHYEHHLHRRGRYREQSRLLRLIAENEGIIQRDLAEKMDVRPSSMTEMLAKIEKSGFILRQHDTKDQRIMHIFLTDQGRSIVKESQENDTILTTSLFNGLTAEEVDEMLRLTEKLSVHLTTIEPHYGCLHEQFHKFGRHIRSSLAHHNSEDHAKQ
ncbi:MarR family winged helix-turn-helix transcriptional regulator [Pectinatus sottacetonis]|uniref:MarR family winged helix-turn-helix transcriptional regulator n=1 Tax=Pectinatus sottacetonis TaxID=1002795 RepID=UPI0018C65CCC|nr:MarR family transcriptional regulator [Pectinatus sottacetonis]